MGSLLSRLEELIQMGRQHSEVSFVVEEVVNLAKLLKSRGANYPHTRNKATELSFWG